jgi:prepilin-type N-terminal cleavage/methylation domain-containing protein
MEKEKGFSLIEVMLAIALLGIIAVAFLGALSTGSKAIIIADERATAESIARSQMEDIKKHDYIYYDVAGHGLYEKITPPSGYDVEFTVVLLDPKGDGTANDDGIQKITVTVKHPIDPTPDVITLEGYKLNR